MDRMKTFLKYLVIFLIFYFASNIVSVQLLKSAYKNKEVFPDFTSPKMEIIESKSTISNGYIKGKITNDTGKDLENQVIELNFFTKRNNNVGTKFIDIVNLKNGETKEFGTSFNFDNVDYIKASLITKEEALKKIGNNKDLNGLFGIDDIRKDKFPWYVWLMATIIAVSAL